ncbi:MAG: HDOD domain-containing protein [Gammaproteobacteria bacterium]|nr:HDOD domain-containing protein [Gammaproteobacteria bacterium]
MIHAGNSVGKFSAAKSGSTGESEPLLDLRQRIAGLEQLPPMPEMTAKVLKLSGDPDAEIKDLVKIIELDPSLAALVMRYASSPFFAYGGKIDSVFTAVTRVLGFNTVMNLALGATAARAFKIPRNVPLGLDAHWQHAIFSAALAQALSAALPSETRPPAGLAYLAGLLHNFGHLILGHLFRQEFLILNKFVTASPERSIVDIEKETLGATHGEVGAWLLESWHLPEEIVVSTLFHHDENYQGEHAVYAHLVMLTDGLLKTFGMGEGDYVGPPPCALEYLGISEYQATTIANRIMEECNALESMALSIAS